MFLSVCSQNANNGTKQASFKQFLAKHVVFFEYMTFVNFDLMGNVPDCGVHSLSSFIRLKTSQCVLSYHNSSFSTGNINGL